MRATCSLLSSLLLFAFSSNGISQEVQSISLETGRSVKGTVILSGRDSGQQLIVTGQLSNGKQQDLTRTVQYSASPPDIVAIENSGWVTGVKEGDAIVQAKLDNGRSASITIQVRNIQKDIPLNFANEVVPLLTKYGCNSGGCHGKADGQNGFKLSLLGFEPLEDYESLVKEARGRRVSPAAPDYSLLLRKATAMIAHGGGKRIELDSPAYRVMRRWIEQGMPYGNAKDPTVKRIEVLPKERLLSAEGSQQLVVVAHYSNGSTRDVTRMAQFESNATDIATVSESGLVATKKQTGTAAIMVRFLTSVDVSLATVPLGAPVADLPPSTNFIDQWVFARLKKLGLPPSELSTDSVFLRRVTLDIAGRLPTLEEAKAFLASKDAQKREKLVDRLLASGDYADYFANKWSAILRNRRASATDDLKATSAFHQWIRKSFESNKHYDQFVREILTAIGKEVENPPVSWYREVKDQSMQVEDTAQLFLGQRIQCARCHHHPFEKWSQKDYYSFAAFFSQVEYKKPPPPPKGNKKKKKRRGPPPPKPLTEVLHKKGIPSAKHPRSGAVLQPAGLGAWPIHVPATLDPRIKLADWLTSSNNPYFAKMLVNRYWKHFFGRGLVDPEDDMRATNPPTNPQLLNALADHFVQSKFDLKALIRAICTSKTYQLSAKSNGYNKEDKQNFSRFQPRRLHAEVLLDAIDQVTGSSTVFRGMPRNTRAVQLPDNAFDSYFLSVFGRPEGASACECERSSDTSLPQLLHLMNSTTIEQKVAGRRAAALSRDKREDKEKIQELYLVALSRYPSDRELSVLTRYLESKGKDKSGAYGDIIWAVLNGEEFLFNH